MPDKAENTTDYYKANSDWRGRRVSGSQEYVDYSNGSTIRIWGNHEPFNFEAHWHTSVEIIMPVDNIYTVKINDNVYEMNPGEIIIIPPGELHELIAPTTGMRFIFMIDISLLTRLKGFSGINTMLSNEIFITKENYPRVYNEIYQLLVSMRNEYFNQKEFAELTIYSHVINLFVILGYNRISGEELFPNVRLNKQKEYVQKFNHIMDYIDTHYMDDLNLEQIAYDTGFSKYHFSRLFKQYTGYTFCDYLCKRRIKVSESLLAQPDLSITDVALMAGFQSISTFNRIFKSQKNCTPSSFRAKNHTDLNNSNL